MANKVKQEATEEQDNVNPEKETDELGEEEQEEASPPLESDADSEEEKSDGKGKEEADEEESEEAESSELDDILKDEESDKSGVQKRIDRLTAEKKEALEQSEEMKSKLKELEEKVTENEASSLFDEKLPDYKPEQVNAAIQKAMEDGDHKLLVEIMDYKVKKGQQDAFKAIEKRNKKIAEQQQKAAEEWQSVVEEFSDEKDKDLNIQDTNSLLYQLASRLFADPKKRDRYQKGGQRLAVMDALRLIWKKKRGKDTKSLEKKLAKQKRKSTVSGTSKTVKKEDNKTEATTPKEKLSEYLKERNKSAYNL